MSGRKNYRWVCLIVYLFLVVHVNKAQTLSFTNESELLNPITGFAGFSDCVVDMNGDYLDDIVRVGEKGVFIDYQQEDGTFRQEQYNFSVQSPPSWSICAGDIDNNGYNDLLFANSQTVSFVKANHNGTAYQETLMPVFIESQRSTIADINNDGWLDGFVCHESDESIPFRNLGDGEMIPDSTLIMTADLPGNYSAIWTDYDNDLDIDLYLSKCLAGALPGDPVRTNLLYRNNNDGTYTEIGAQAGVDDNAQSWSTVFEDFDHDGDFDAFVVNHDMANRLYRNNGNGTFTDVIASSGIDPLDLGAFENSSGDFDNDGHPDIFSDLISHFYLGNGDLTFIPWDAPMVPGGIGDLNNDGFLDVFSNNQLWINEGNQKHWIKINTHGIVSNRNGIGARLELYGAWGRQIREVRSGQSYSPMSSLTTHFGIGTHESIDSLIIRWPSGIITKLDHVVSDTTYIIPETECLLPTIDLEVSGVLTLCPEESISIPGPDGFVQYQWSNGDTTRFALLTDAGRYHLLAKDSAGCVALSEQVVIEKTADKKPEIFPQSSVRLCDGDTLVLVSSPGENYRWSTGEILTPSIKVTESGNYTVAVDAVCFDGQITSDPVEINFLPVENPIGETIYLLPGDSALLIASGENIHWFDASVGGMLLAVGDSLQTNALNASDTFYVEAHHPYAGEMQSGGKPDTSGPGGLSGQSGSLLFKTWETFILNSVTIYIPPGGAQGIRFVQLYNGDSLVAFKPFPVQTGFNILNLDFEVTPGLHILASPQGNMFRNAGQLDYPYPIGDVGEITGSAHGENFYYYFYDWKITKPELTCVSDRVPFYVIVSSNEEIDQTAQVVIYPNPAQNELNVSLGDMIYPFEMSVINSFGMIVREKKDLNSITFTVDLEGLVPGIYFLQIKSENGIGGKKFSVY